MIKKIYKILFSRQNITIISIILQIAIIISIILYASRYQVLVFVMLEIISIITAFIILNKDFNPAYKLSFILLILLLPFVGISMYYIFGRTKYNRKIKKNIEDANNNIKNKYNRNVAIANEIIDQDAYKIYNYIYTTTSMTIYNNTSTKLLTPGEEMFDCLINEIKKAERFIFLEYFIIDVGHVWDKVYEILLEKVKNNVEVRIIYDDFGCINKLPNKLKKELINNGIKVYNFNSYNPLIVGMMNYRDHRKITIIDGKTGIVGGINLADEYINKKRKFGYWKDSALLLEGEAVWNLTLLYIKMWSLKNNIKEEIDKYKSVYDNKKEDYGYVQPFGSSAFDNELTTENVYISLINSAKKSIYITTPYLIIDNELITTLKIAANSGVDVRIMVPHIPDKKIVFLITKSYYQILINNNVKIYEFLPGFLHSKTIVVDGKMAMIGSANLDYRSLYLHFEVSCFMYNTKSTKELEEDFIKNINLCMEITKESVKKNNTFINEVLVFILKVFTPLM